MTKIEEILIDLQAMGHSISGIERVLELEQGSLNIANFIDDPEVNNPELLTLLKIVHTYPWILKVADQNFDLKFARSEMMHNAVDVVLNEMSKKEEERK